MTSSLDEISAPDEVRAIFKRMWRGLQDLATEVSRELNQLEEQGVGYDLRGVRVEWEAGGYRYILTQVPAKIRSGLTRREAEVVELVVQGLGNRAIAEKLEIERPTVAAHLRNIYRKLGVKSRTQLAWERLNVCVGLDSN